MGMYGRGVDGGFQGFELRVTECCGRKCVTQWVSCGRGREGRRKCAVFVLRNLRLLRKGVVVKRIQPTSSTQACYCTGNVTREALLGFSGMYFVIVCSQTRWERRTSCGNLGAFRVFGLPYVLVCRL